MMKRNLVLALLIIIYLPIHAQINKKGIPLINNYAPNDYNASEQNWAICEDNRGVVYVGNTDGVLEFDGSNWKKIIISNGSIVRSLAASEEGTVYVGGVEEFGYLAPDLNGKMYYHTLIDQLDSIDFKDVWKIYTIKEKVYFCCADVIFMFEHKKLNKIYSVPTSFLSFNINSKLYWGSYDNGLYELKEDTFLLSNGGDFYKEKDIFIMLPWSENEIIIATWQGIYIYNKLTGLTKAFESLGPEFRFLTNILNESQPYNGIKLSDDKYAIATLGNGCLIFNQEGELVFKLDKDNGLYDITVINLFESKYGQLWLGLNKGISFVELNTPFTKFGQEYGIEGIIVDVVKFNETLFVATNLGLYYQYFKENGKPYFKKVEDINTMVWKLVKVKLNDNKIHLLAGTSLNVYEIIDTKNVENLNFNGNSWQNCYSLFQSKLNSNLIYVGFKDGLGSFEYNGGTWSEGNHHKEITTSQIESIVQDNKENLWLGTPLSGIMKYSLKDGSLVTFGLEEGLPNLDANKVYFIDDNIVCATKKGVYFYNDNSNRFEKYDGFGEKYFSCNDEIRNILSEKEDEYWITSVDPISNYEYLEKLKISQDRIISIQDLPFKRLLKNLFYNIAYVEDNSVWIATSNAIYNYQENLQEDFSKYYNSLIRKVELGIDSVVFWGTFYDDTTNLIVNINQPEELKNTVKYKNNSFNFFYSTPFVPTDEIKYSTKLEGFDDNWSNWDVKTERGYTNLNEGNYTFMVKAKNIYGIESEIVSYEFTIKPPWFRTILAYFVYVVIAMFVIYIIVKIYTRRLELEKIRLEQIVKERTEEVVKQKDELEIQRDEIADKNRSITDSIEYAKRIQNAVLPSKEFADEILPEHFILFRPRDIVSGDFYWMTKKGNNIVIIAADCTGHGVPGAFMSMLGVSFLNEIVNRHQVTSADVILNSLRTDIKKTMGQKGKEGEAKDGMDIALCIIDQEEMKMQYAGAYNPLYLFRNNELIEYKADRMPIGIYVKEKESFTNNIIDLQKGDVFYIASDGYQDQFGGEDGQKFKTKNYKELLLEIHQKPMAEQREILNKRIDEWRGRWEQVDDIIILGIRI
jgi:serine phosphatase RsbU (regulator of sigma subunit)/ligand-binding sensor domain-containing protein